MPFHDQEGLARRAALLGGHLRRERLRDQVTEVLHASSKPMPAPDIADRSGLNISTVRRTINGMLADGLIRREPWAFDPQTWAFQITLAGANVDHIDHNADLRFSRCRAQMASAAVRRDRTRTCILATLDVWPTARTARYIADHIGMSTSAVTRAITSLVDSGAVLMTPHPFNTRQRTYHLPHPRMLNSKPQ